MSHLTICKISIKNPDVMLLRQVFEVLAKEYNTNISNIVRDYFGRERKVLFALDLRAKGQARGIGVVIEDGELVVVGDDWAFGALFEEVRSKIVQYYTALAVSRIANMLGFQIANVQQTPEAIVIDLTR